ncbi:MAG: hypothetical protein WCX69_02325 [Candidatus Paceibacterota bacterium]
MEDKMKFIATLATLFVLLGLCGIGIAVAENYEFNTGNMGISVDTIYREITVSNLTGATNCTETGDCLKPLWTYSGKDYVLISTKSFVDIHKNLMDSLENETGEKLFALEIGDVIVAGYNINRVGDEAVVGISGWKKMINEGHTGCYIFEY